MTAVRFTRRALRDAERIDDWWRAHRRAAADLFTSELAQAIRLLRSSPELAPVYRAARPPAIPIRRLLLQETQQHVYYRYHPSKSLVIVLAVWSTRRERAPSIR